MDDESAPAAASSTKTPICAIGASAGGVNALQNLFRHGADNLGLAYVVILHLSPDRPSLLGEVLARCTRMPVHQVHDSPTLKPNCVYVIAPDRELVIEDDTVSSRPFSEPRGHRAPIDMFFRSIAAARGDGVAIVLSGSGSDGATGIRAVKEAGGIVMVQDPAEAEFGAMPQNAIATGVVDFVGPVARLAERLHELAHSKEAVRSLDMHSSANDLRRIVGFLRNRTGHDFSSYKRSTIMRRVGRRMQVCNVDTLGAYAEYLQSTPEEAKELFSDLLISVTMFFREPRAFEALVRHAIGPILDDHSSTGSDEGVRAWVVGCATGEEAYSLAILFLEEAERRQLHLPIQIFATDLSEGALATAREGRYPKSIEADVSEQRLARFFVDEGTHYRVRKEVRDSVLFATHSVLKEPPFMRLDLISCRNLLIYLERSLQQQLSTVFHYALKTGRFLFMGSAESADTAADLFTTLDREARIYASRSQAAHTMAILPQFPTPDRILGGRPVQQAAAEQAHIAAAAHSSALERLAPPSIMVDANQTIINLSPTAGRFILHSAGPISSLLPSVVRPELRLDLKLALTRALSQGLTTTTHPVVTAFDGERRRINMHVAPVPVQPQDEAEAIVFFLDGGTVAEAEQEIAPSEARPEEIRRLHAELKAAHEALVASRSGHEATIQELRAANEELQSTNEEYRSTAEELETSREELQSINEELHTVNAELKSKLEHLSVAHSDLENLTAATEVGTLFLDSELRIKMFTPPIAEIFNITRFDVGRVITDFTNRLDHPPLVEEASAVLRNLAPVEREVQGNSGRHYVLRMRPYRTVEDRIDGVVLTFVDITARMKMERAVNLSEQQFRSLVRASSQVLYRMNADWTEMRELFDGGFLSSSEMPNRNWLELYIPPEDRERLRATIDRAIVSKSIFEMEHRVFRADGTVGWTHSRAIPIMDPESTIIEWFGSADDVTLRRRAQGAARESEERLRVLVEGVPQLVWRAQSGGRWTWSSPQWHRYTGLSEVESRDHGWLAAVHPDDRDQVLRAWDAGANNLAFEVECRLRNMERPGYRWFRGQATALLDSQGGVAEWLGTFTDIDDLRILQQRQEVLLAELQHRVRNILAVIRSMVSRTAASHTSVSEYAERLEGRIASLARTQVILTRAPGGKVDVETMIRDELAAQAPQGLRIDLQGPVVSLSPKAAEVLTLAIHELTTNAVKYGALARADGAVEVRWSLAVQNGENWLTLTWTESGNPTASAAPERRGFGTELIERRVPYELEGHGSLEFLPAGIRAQVAFPLRPGDSILQTDAQTVRTLDGRPT